MKTPHVGVLAARLLAATCLVAPLRGQDPEAWRAPFAAGEEARRAGDVEVYARQMAAAARVMPEGRLNRPFVQYHAARAAALAGRPGEAIDWLETAWEEDIESLIISYAPFDPAFDEMVDTAPFRELMGRAANMELAVRPLAGDLYLIQGAGSNLLVHMGEEGTLLVDTGYGPALPALRRALASLGGGDPSHLIVTHPHEDHMGSTPELADAVMVAHPGTTEAMREPYVFMEGVSMPPKPPSALPDLEVDSDTTLVLAGVRVRLVPTVAHTGGDLSVYFPDAHVAHLGDTYLAAEPMMFPGTEDPDGFLDRLEAFLDSMDPETVVVGGHEEPADLAAVGAQISESRAAMSLVRDAIDRGLTLEETAELGAHRFPPQWLGFFYRLFTRDEG